MNRNDLERDLREKMQQRGWAWQRFCHLQTAFIRNIEISPVFLPNFIRKPAGDYVIDGYVGVVHQGFEKYWLQEHRDQDAGGKRNRFCLIRNIANIPKLLYASYIHSGDADEELEIFCSTIGAVLEELPHDTTALRVALETNVMLGASLEKYIAYGGEEKFGELRKFVLDAGK